MSCASHYKNFQSACCFQVQGGKHFLRLIEGVGRGNECFLAYFAKTSIPHDILAGEHDGFLDRARERIVLVAAEMAFLMVLWELGEVDGGNVGAVGLEVVR